MFRLITGLVRSIWRSLMALGTAIWRQPTLRALVTILGAYLLARPWWGATTNWGVIPGGPAWSGAAVGAALLLLGSAGAAAAHHVAPREYHVLITVLRTLGYLAAVLPMALAAGTWLISVLWLAHLIGIALALLATTGIVAYAVYGPELRAPTATIQFDQQPH